MIPDRQSFWRQTLDKSNLQTSTECKQNSPSTTSFKAGSMHSIELQSFSLRTPSSPEAHCLAIWMAFPMHPRWFQRPFRPPANVLFNSQFKIPLRHREKEREAGREINSAAQKQNRSSAGMEDDECKLISDISRSPDGFVDWCDQVCRRLEETPSTCKANADGLLDW